MASKKCRHLGKRLIANHRRALVLVADRVITFTEPVGQDSVTAGTDCGLGGRIHPQIA